MAHDVRPHHFRPPEFRMIETNGIRLRAAICGEGPLIVLVHGFPESWYSWRHQMGPLSAAGFTACAIDVRGYGGSDKPGAVEDYDMRAMTGDVAGVIDALSPDAPAIIIGHDWGAPIVWHAALLHPEKFRAVAGLSVPWTGYSATPFIDIMRAIYTERGKFFYQIYFQDEGVAEAELEADVRGALRRTYYMACGDAPDLMLAEKTVHDTFLTGLPDPQPFPAWLSEADIDYFTHEFERSGFRGALNRYRNFHRDHAFMAGRADYTIRQPALFIGGERDPVLRMAPGADLMAGMRGNMADLRGAHIIPGIGHWTQQEAPDETTGLLIDWLATL
ncbi:MAG: alpha/beta fold hydrolase [Hyphomonadaceae bacterium]